jgi:hypothetical protein
MLLDNLVYLINLLPNPERPISTTPKNSKVEGSETGELKTLSIRIEEMSEDTCMLFTSLGIAASKLVRVIAPSPVIEDNNIIMEVRTNIFFIIDLLPNYIVILNTKTRCRLTIK